MHMCQHLREASSCFRPAHKVDLITLLVTFGLFATLEVLGTGPQWVLVWLPVLGMLETSIQKGGGSVTYI